MYFCHITRNTETAYNILRYCRNTLIPWIILQSIVLIVGLTISDKNTSGFTLDYVGCFNANSSFVPLAKKDYNSSQFKSFNLAFHESDVHVACQATCMGKHGIYFAIAHSPEPGVYSACSCGNTVGIPQNESYCPFQCGSGKKCGGLLNKYNSVFKVFTDIGCLNLDNMKSDYTVRRKGGEDSVAAKCRKKCLFTKNTPFFGLRKGEQDENNIWRVKCYCIPGDQLDYGNLHMTNSSCNYTVDGINCGGKNKFASIFPVCPAGYFGVNKTTNATCITPCSYNSTVYNPDAGNCTACPQGLTGQLCLQDYDECVNSTLCGPGTCNNTVGGYTCQCHEGYSLNEDNSACLDTNECNAGINWCPYGSCVNSIGSFYCVNCTTGYKETPTVCRDINECANTSICGGGNCTNQQGSYMCECYYGYHAVDKNSYCADIDECTTNNGGCGYNCTNVPGYFNCTCMVGYDLDTDGKTCIDVDECLNTTICQNGTCHNVNGSYSCSCEEGFAPGNDNKSCQENNECLDLNGGCSDTCVNTKGSYMCSCRAGYALQEDKRTCHDVDECLNTTICQNGTCHNVNGSYSCSCEEGFVPGNDHKSCDDIDDCIGNKAVCSDICNNTEGSYTCHCREGYTLQEDRKTCHAGAGVPLELIVASILVPILVLIASIVLCYIIVKKSGRSLIQEWRRISKGKKTSTSQKPGSSEEQKPQMEYNMQASRRITEPPRMPSVQSKVQQLSSGNSTNKRESMVNPANHSADTDTNSRITAHVTPKATPKLTLKSLNTEAIYGNLGPDAPTNTVIPVAEFVECVNKIKADATNPFMAEYDALPQGPCSARNYASQPELKGKNRFKDILPYDNNRVKLKVLEGNPLLDYINASYIQGYSEKDKFIAALGPRPSTVDDFWRMVWEQDCHLIVMLTNLVEAGVTKCQQYWPDAGYMLYGGVRVTLVTADVKPEYVIRTFVISNCDDQSRLVNQYHFTVWPDHGVPRYAGSLIEFRRKMARNIVPNKPTIVHCSAGIGRTGTLIALDYLLNQAAAEGIVDVFTVITRFREQRSGMVQTRAQYWFIHDALVEYITVGDTSIADYALSDAITSLNETDAQGKTAYDNQLKFLESSVPIVDVYDKRECLNDENEHKNRNTDILPRSSVIVTLTTQIDHKNNYINAVFVNSYLRKDDFIATQVPLEDTVVDFWRLVHDQQSRIIVMIITADQIQDIPTFLPVQDNHVSLPGFVVVSYETSHQYPPGLTTKNFTIVNTVEEDLDTDIDCNSDYINTADIIPGKSVREIGVKMCILTLARGQQLLQAGQSMDLISLVRMISDNDDKIRPVVVMSMDGCDLCGQYIAHYNMLKMLRSENEVNIYQICRHIKDSRPEFIGSVEQYRHLFSTALAFVGEFDTYSVSMN